MTTSIEKEWDRLDDAVMREDINIGISGRLHATIEASATPDILIDRDLHLERDKGNTWLIYSIPPGSERDLNAPVAEIVVTDPEIMRFLDSLYRMIANPIGFRNRRFGPERGASSQDAA